MDKFAALNAFIAVVESGGFSPAARRLGVAPSSLTRQLNALENSLGTLLLNRSTRTITLTEAGQLYYDDGRRILEDLEQADRLISEQGGSPSGLLCISLPAAFGRLHIAPILPQFLHQFPNIRFEIEMSDSISNLVEDRFDVAIRLGTPISQNLIARKLAPHQRIVCASPGYLQERGIPLNPSELADHNCLLFDYSHKSNTWIFTQEDKLEKVTVRGNIHANNSELLREAAIGGAGLLLMPTWLVGADIAAGRLLPVLEKWSVNIGVEESAIWAVYSQNRRGSKKLTAFIDFLVQHFEVLPY